MSGHLVEENNKLGKYTLSLEESLRHLKEINVSFKMEINKLRSSKEECN